MLDTLNDACGVARRLIGVLKQEAGALAAGNGMMSATLSELKAEFIGLHGSIFDLLRGDPSLLGPVELSRSRELEALIAEMATAPLDSLIEANPEAVEFIYERAGILLSQGRDDAAIRDYQEILSIQPTHFQTLTDFGNLLMESGNHNAALGLFSQAVAAYPEQACARVNLADLLLSMADYENAKHHYEVALDLQPGLHAAHQGLSLALVGLGDETGAAEHREAGFRGQALITWPHRGGGSCIPLLILSSALGGNIPIRHVLDDRIFHSSVVLTEYFDKSRPPPEHKLIVNLVGDADLCGAGLAAAEAIIGGSVAPVINHPRLIRATGRLENARRLAMLPGVTVPRTVLLTREALSAATGPGLLAEHGIGFPMLLRSLGFHTGQFFVRVENEAELAQAVARLPGLEVLAMELLDSRNSQGDYHKYRVMFVDGALFPLHLAISKHWKVHYFSADMNANAGYRKLEEAFLRDMPGVLGEPAMTALQEVSRTLGLDYGGIDFAVGEHGDIRLFEANAAMAVHKPDDKEIWAYRRDAAERIHVAVRDMIIGRAGGL